MRKSANANEELTRYPHTGRFLLGRLRRGMGDREKRILENAITETETITEPRRIVHRGKVYDRSSMLIEGFVLRTLDGPEQRYGVSFHVPGDFVDLHCFALKRLDHNIDTIGSVTLGYVPHDRLAEIMRDEPHLARLFWFSTLLDAAMHREWVMKLEQLTAPRRLAHIFAEIWRRLEMVGLGDAGGFDTPLTQSDLAEMSGSTTIHANRAIKELRERGIAEMTRGRIDIPDRDALEAFAKFEPDYLYGEGTLAHREGPE
ncbi:Crp/Fnr family transcriptional regulator [Erythrobacter sp.]|jgi:CRP-like cAMP-binding protein|uniref:Crp/Fnr family transcriptional regulator n=1 Tax=Erythrobacter sp. TaxID=1042 RepID=UPI002EB6B44B|nr:Crp/Fnr family transcriptional regulator [Erythrobacter sp.]